MSTKTVTIEGWIVFDSLRERHPSIWPHPFTFSESEQRADGDVTVQPYSFTVQVPDSFDPRPGLVAGLEAKKRELQAEFAARVTEIERQISELQALEFTPA